MTPADRVLVNALIVFVCEEDRTREVDASIDAIRRSLSRRDRMAEPFSEGLVAAAERLVAQVDRGAFQLRHDSRRYVRLALADFFIERRNAALSDLA